MDSTAVYISRFDYDDVGSKISVQEVSRDRVTWTFDDEYELPSR